MRVIASVQPKRGSSRGLIHYVAHSKIDTEREPEKGRELFNAFADELSVKSANNSIKADILSGRPSNDELHHLVLSFRLDDYRALGRTEKQRRSAVKETTRAAMKRLESALDADRISWVSAVHLNTGNPHVHVAIQKEFLARDLETRYMTKIPRQALPHFARRDGEKTLTPGILIEAATEKMEQLIAAKLELVRSSKKGPIRDEPESFSHEKREKETDSENGRKTNEERDILRCSILAEDELRRIGSKIEMLIDHGDQMRFRVTDPVTGKKRRLSLRDLEVRGATSDPDPNASPERQIRTVLFKMLAREEAVKARLQKVAGDTIREANRVKSLYKKNAWKLPTPSLTKDEVDKLQEHRFEDSNVRGFSYLEIIRTELERSREIEPRSEKDFGRLSAQKTISEMRKRLLEKDYADLNDTQYYRLVDVGDKRVSLSQIDREENTSTNAGLGYAQKLKEMALRLVGKGKELPVTTENGQLTNDIVNRLSEQLSGIRKDQKTEENKVKILDKILTANRESKATDPSYSSEQLGEIETLSLKLKLRSDYEKNWNEQRTLIESAVHDCMAYRKLHKANPAADFVEYKNNIISGRALAREIIAKVELDKAKEDLKTFTESKHFQKFAIADKKTGSIAFLSLHDVDLHHRGSLLDRALEEILESRENRALRRTVTSLVKGREQRLKREVGAAKDIMASAFREAIEFKQSSFFGLRSEPVHGPIFTSAEITAIELRGSSAKDPKEAERLQKILESAAGQPARSLKEILRDFENSPTTSQPKFRDLAVTTGSERTAVVQPVDQTNVPSGPENVKESKFYGPSH